MDRKRVIGIGFIVTAILIIVMFFSLQNQKEDAGHKVATVKGETTDNFMTINENTEVETNDETTTVVETTEQITQSEDKEVELIRKIEIRDVNDEVLQILECDEDELYKLIQTFANGYGYSNAKITSYAGTCTIDHIKNIKTATFYFYTYSKKTIYFDVILNRETKKLSCRLQ